MAVIAYHLIWTNYGTWPPNDLRGSGSHEVYTPALAELGPAHLGRKKNQPSRGEQRDFCEQVEQRLQFPVIHFVPSGQALIAAGFAGGYQTRAVHLLCLRDHARPRSHSRPQAPTSGRANDRVDSNRICRSLAV